MSTKTAIAFLEQAATDPVVGGKVEGSSTEERIASAVRVGHDYGFEFTEDDIVTLLESGGPEGEGELSEGELELVSGGGIGAVWAWMVNTFGGNDSDSSGPSVALGVRA